MEGIKSKRTKSDRSPDPVKVVRRKSIKHGSEYSNNNGAENKYTNNGSSKETCVMEDKKNSEHSTPTKIGVTPYWKVAEERGMSPRETRSASAKKKKKKGESSRPITEKKITLLEAELSSESAVSSSCHTSNADEIPAPNKLSFLGTTVLEFSPPNYVENVKRERLMDKQRQAKLKARRRQEGDVFFLSPVKDIDVTMKQNQVKMMQDSVKDDSLLEQLQRQCQTMETMLEQKQSEIDDYLAENTHLKAHVAKLDHSINELRITVDSNTANQSIQEVKRQELESSNEELRKAIDRLIQKSLEKEKSSFDSSQKESRVLTDKLNQLETAHKIILDENTSLKASLDDSRKELRIIVNAHTANQSVQEETRQQLESKNNELRKAIDRLTHDHEAKENAMNEHWQKKNKELADKLNHLENTYKNILDQNTSLKAHVATLDDSNKELKLFVENHTLNQSVKEEARLQLELTNNELRQAIDRLTYDLQQRDDAAIDSIQKENMALVDKVNQLESEYKIVVEQNTSLTAHVATLDDSNKELKMIVEKQIANNSVLEKARLQLESSNEKQQEVITYLNEKLVDMQKDQILIDLLQKENKEIVETVQQLEIKNADLRHSLVLQESSHHDSIIGWQKELDHVRRSAIESFNKEIMDLKDKYESKERRLLHHLQVQDEIRRALHNRVLQLTGNMIVYVRVRPPTFPSDISVDTTPFTYCSIQDRDISFGAADEDLTKHALVITEPFKDRGGLTPRQKKYKFCFDHVFTHEHKQDNVWRAVEPIVQSAIDGYNVCLFAYGQTGSGKTFTMLGSDEQPGIIYRAVEKLFSAKGFLENRNDCNNIRVQISVEMLEIYNETVRDLLSPKSEKGYQEVCLRLNANEAVGNVVRLVDDKSGLLEILSLAQTRRCVRATKSNEESSRSHLLFTLNFDLLSDKYPSRHGKLHVCDLAGSERLSKSESTGVSLKETQHINMSLSNLSHVIEKLQDKSSHVPYRDSKLTYLLRNSLGGDSKTLAIVCCSPSADHFQESLCSLRFAQRASRIELKRMSNVSV